MNMATARLSPFPHSRLPAEKKKHLLWSEAGHLYTDPEAAQQKILDTARKFDWLSLTTQHDIPNPVGAALNEIIAGADFTVLAVAHKPFMLGGLNFSLMGVVGLRGKARETMEVWLLDHRQVCVLLRIE